MSWLLDLITTSPALVAGGGWAIAGLAVVAWIKNRPLEKQMTLNADGNRDGLQAARITELERRMDDEKRSCDARIDHLSTRIIVVAQSAMELSTVVERHDPNAPALARAKLALQHAFPLNFKTDDEMKRLSRELARKAARDRRR